MLSDQCVTVDGMEGEKRHRVEVNLPHLIDTLQCILCPSSPAGSHVGCKRLQRDICEDSVEKEDEGEKKKKKKKKTTKKRKLSAE
jgi:hypothetical protein